MGRDLLDIEREVKEAKRKSRESLIWAFIALGVSILRIVLEEFGLI